MAKKFVGQAVDSAAALVTLPAKAEQTLDMVQKGHVKVGMQLSSTEKFARDLRASAGLIAISLIAMALVLGACILGSGEQAVHIGGIPVVGVIGLIVGIVLIVYVFVKIRPYLK
jgi:hypothetical protein